MINTLWQHVVHANLAMALHSVLVGSNLAFFTLAATTFALWIDWMLE